jgi:hypothetical protein
MVIRINAQIGIRTYRMKTVFIVCWFYIRTRIINPNSLLSYNLTQNPHYNDLRIYFSPQKVAFPICALRMEIMLQ